MEAVTEDAPSIEVPKKKVLTPEQFDKLCAGIEAKQLAAGTDLSLYDWALENVELNDGQRLQIDVCNKPQNFVL
jgi:hypothetical protein